MTFAYICTSENEHFKEPKPGGLVRMLFLWFQELISKFHLCFGGRNQTVQWISLTLVSWQQVMSTGNPKALPLRPTNNPLRLIETVETVEVSFEPFLYKLYQFVPKKTYYKYETTGFIHKLPWPFRTVLLSRLAKKWWVPDCRINYLNLNTKDRGNCAHQNCGQNLNRKKTSNQAGIGVTPFRYILTKTHCKNGTIFWWWTFLK